MSLLDIAPIVPGLGERGAAREAWIRGPPRRLEASYGAALRPCAAPVPVCIPSRPRSAHPRPHRAAADPFVEDAKGDKGSDETKADEYVHIRIQQR